MRCPRRARLVRGRDDDVVGATNPSHRAVEMVVAVLMVRSGAVRALAADHATSIDSNALIAVSAALSGESASGPMLGMSSDRSPPSATTAAANSNAGRAPATIDFSNACASSIACDAGVPAYGTKLTPPARIRRDRCPQNHVRESIARTELTACLIVCVLEQRADHRDAEGGADLTRTVVLVLPATRLVLLDVRDFHVGELRAREPTPMPKSTEPGSSGAGSCSWRSSTPLPRPTASRTNPMRTTGRADHARVPGTTSGAPIAMSAPMGTMWAPEGAAQEVLAVLEEHRGPRAGKPNWPSRAPSSSGGRSGSRDGEAVRTRTADRLRVAPSRARRWRSPSGSPLRR